MSSVDYNRFISHYHRGTPILAMKDANNFLVVKDEINL